MLLEVFRELEQWIVTENEERKLTGTPLIGPCTIRILGQTALIEALVQLHLVATQDVDAYLSGDQIIQTEFDRLLKSRGKEFDKDSYLIWMPIETEYSNVFTGRLITGQIAQPEYVLLSKASKAPDKNKILIKEFLSLGATPTFLRLAKKYQLDLRQFV